jgi:hypothetical protein
MSTARLEKKARDEYERRLRSGGQDALYRFVVGKGVISRADCGNPELIILDHSDAFFSLYRQTGQEIYFIIGKILRRAAHSLYRELRRIDKNKNINARFLNIVK